MRFELHDHQARALDALRASLLAGKRRPMVQAPTGAGKTVLAAAIVDGALKKGKRVLFTVPFLNLIDQTVEAFSRRAINAVGVMQGYHPQTDGAQPVQVASIQTLQRRRIPDADVVIIDEAHRWFRFMAAWLAAPEWQSKPFIGLSATPWTKGLGQALRRPDHRGDDCRVDREGLPGAVQGFRAGSSRSCRRQDRGR